MPKAPRRLVLRLTAEQQQDPEAVILAVRQALHDKLRVVLQVNTLHGRSSTPGHTTQTPDEPLETIVTAAVVSLLRERRELEERAERLAEENRELLQKAAVPPSPPPTVEIQTSPPMTQPRERLGARLMRLAAAGWRFTLGALIDAGLKKLGVGGGEGPQK